MNVGEDRALFILEQRELLGTVADMDPIPELHVHLIGVWSMYQLLRNSRSIGFGTLGYVPLSEITAALDMYQIREPEWRIYYTLLLQALDQAYVSWWTEKHEPKGKK